ncbi:MAG: hypothetical protein QXV64_03670 [Candidatus Anstonellaceae archaeon]
MFDYLKAALEDKKEIVRLEEIWTVRKLKETPALKTSTKSSKRKKLGY